ncbi:MAG: DUF465 domain-containing protein [Amphiplicatus sp.]
MTDLPTDATEGKQGKSPINRFEAREQDFNGANDEALLIKLQIVQQEHADLDAAIRALESQAHHDRLSVARLKKKKLRLKDQMQEIQDQMTPDIIA